jgi:hypothetical protein
VDQYTRHVAEDLGAVSIQLQAKNRDYWDTYDRLLAETNFRLAISFSLVFIIIIFGVQSSPLWLVLLVVPFWLFILAYRLSYDCFSTLVQAIVLGMVGRPVSNDFVKISAKKRRGAGLPNPKDRYDGTTFETDVLTASPLPSRCRQRPDLWRRLSNPAELDNSCSSRIRP